MKGKCYDQVPYCPMAHALSLVGERWSLLIVRELLHGPRRYTDLANGLPGIGTNILAARLKDLEAFGVVEKKKLPPPYASTVYELTPYGKELDEVLYALGRWGARTLGPPVFEEELYPEWGLNALPGLFDPAAAQGLTETYVLKVGDDVFTARVVDGHLRADVGAAADADVTVGTDMKTLWALTNGELTPSEALAAGQVASEGSEEAFERFFEVFHMAPRTIAA
jgi:DNA-binding HxlR family transcriptional regulator